MSRAREAALTRARRTRSVHRFVAAASFASAAKVRFSFVRFLVAPTERRRCSEWSAPNTRICPKATIKKYREAAPRQEGQESQEAPSSARRSGGKLPGGRRRIAAVGGSFSTACAPGAVAPVFSRRLWRPRHARHGGPARPEKSGAITRVLELALRLRLGMPRQEAYMAIATAPVDFDSFDRSSKPTPRRTRPGGAEGLRRAPERVARCTSGAGAAGDAATRQSRHRRWARRGPGSTPRSSSFAAGFAPFAGRPTVARSRSRCFAAAT